MGFISRENKPKAQVSLNSFSGAVDAVVDAGAALVGHVADAGSTAVRHVKGISKHANSDLKYNMQHKSGRAIDN